MKKTQVVMGVVMLIALLMMMGCVNNKDDADVNTENEGGNGLLEALGGSTATSVENPKDILTDYMRVVKKGDNEKALGFLTKEAQKEYKHEIFSGRTKAQIDNAKYQTVHISEQSESTAFVRLYVDNDKEPDYKYGFHVYPLVEEKFAWKINYIYSGIAMANTFEGKIEEMPKKNTPEGVAMAFYKAKEDQEIEKAKAYLSKGFLQEIEEDPRRLRKEGNKERGVILLYLSVKGRVNLCSLNYNCDEVNFEIRCNEGKCRINEFDII